MRRPMTKDSPKPQPAHSLDRLVRRLRLTATTMLNLGADMNRYGGMGEIGDHGREMIGAGLIAREWADKMTPPNDKCSHGADNPKA